MAKVVTLVRTQEFETIECGECGVVFAIESWLKSKWVDERHAFVCPNGHHRRFVGETEAERVKRVLTAQLDEARRDAEWARVRANNAEKRVSAQKGQITKLRKRVANGVCPCCHRTFSQLAAHMKLKHPDYVSSEEPEADDAVARPDGTSTD